MEQNYNNNNESRRLIRNVVRHTSNTAKVEMSLSLMIDVWQKLSTLGMAIEAAVMNDWDANSLNMVNAMFETSMPDSVGHYKNWGSEERTRFLKDIAAVCLSVCDGLALGSDRQVGFMLFSAPPEDTFKQVLMMADELDLPAGIRTKLEKLFGESNDGEDDIQDL